MADPALARLAHSEDWTERVRAAQVVVWSDVADREAIVLRLLADPDSSAVREAMVMALLEARREGAIRLILRSLGQNGAGEVAATLLEGLLDSELDGLDVRGSIVSVLFESGDRDALLGALTVIDWLAPSGGFQAPARALARVGELAEDSDEAIRVAATRALAAFDSPWQQPDVG
jgi:HEAT repeat protein